MMEKEHRSNDAWWCIIYLHLILELTSLQFVAALPEIIVRGSPIHSLPRQKGTVNYASSLINYNIDWRPIFACRPVHRQALTYIFCNGPHSCFMMSNSFVHLLGTIQATTPPSFRKLAPLWFVGFWANAMSLNCGEPNGEV